MGLALVVPIAWGIATDHFREGEWIGLTAEAICWVELKGTIAQRLRTVLGGIFLVLCFTALGSITGFNLFLSVAAMLVVGFLSGMFKNLGDRGSGLSICVYVLFIISNAIPAGDAASFWGRLLLTGVGGTWALLLSLLSNAFLRQHEPYRRSIALIWRSIGTLMGTIAKGWDAKAPRSTLREVYEKEKGVRAALDTSFLFHEAFAHQFSRKSGREYDLAQVRKASALAAAHILAIGEALEGISIRRLENTLRLNLYAMCRALQQAIERMSVYLVSLQPEEDLLLQSRIDRVREFASLIQDSGRVYEPESLRRVQRILHLTERTLRLLERSRQRLQGPEGERMVYRSYSLVKTLVVLHPRHWVQSIRLLFRLTTETSRYALRLAFAAALALAISKGFEIKHGYWLPFTVILISQPYIGATLQKSLDRIIGTILGGLAGGGFIFLRTGIYVKEALLFVCAVLMVYYIRRRYAVATFFITLSLVLLFAVEEEARPELIITRALCTVGGAALAIVAGFFLLPTWDRKQLPRHLAEAFRQNYRYFLATFYSTDPSAGWTRCKRSAEQANSRAFESLQRYLQEPGSGHKNYISPYQVVTHNVRLTRELNQIHLEWENFDKNTSPIPVQAVPDRIQEALKHANRILLRLREQGHLADVHPVPLSTVPTTNAPLLPSQLDLLDKFNLELQAYERDLTKATVES
jgi:hypothetical protein